MKKVFAIVIALLLFALTACGQQQGNQEQTQKQTQEQNQEQNQENIGGNTQIPNPWVDCDTLTDAARLAGFDITVPGGIEGYPNRMIQAMEKSMIQVMYFDGDPEAEDGSRVIVRKGTGTEDISGDYNEYPETETANIHGVDVTLKGEGGLVFCAIWTMDGYSYAIDADKGLSRTALENAIEEMVTVAG